MKYITIISLMAGLFLGPALQAQEALSLSRAIEIGLEHNFSIQIEEANKEIATTNNHWGNTSAMPSLDFNVSSGHTRYQNHNEMDYSQIANPGLSLNWNLFNGFSARIQKQKLDELQALSEGNVMLVVENTIEQIILAYYAAQLEKGKMEAAEKLMLLSQDRYRRDQALKDNGKLGTFDLLQSENAALQDSATYYQQQTILNNSLRELKLVMGVKEDQGYQLSDDLSYQDTPMDVNLLQQQMEASNANLKNQFINQMLLQQEVKSAQSGYYPSLQLQAGLNSNHKRTKMEALPDAISTDYQSGTIGLNLSFKIFDGGYRRRSVQVAKINQEIGEIRIQEMQTSLQNRLQQYHDNFQLSRFTMKLALRQEESAQLNLSLSQEKFSNGSINSFNYRDIQLIYLNAVNNRLQQNYNYLQTRLALVKISGGIIQEYSR